jgi:Uma2 family endonuclease
VSRSFEVELTAEQLAHRPDLERYELVRGMLRVSEPPGGAHGAVAVRLASLLHAHVAAHGLGIVLVETGYVVARAPDTVRGPDVSFTSRDRLGAGPLPAAFIPFAPDLAVEILSPDDRVSDVEEKVADYLDGGTRLVWLVDPARRSVTVRRSGGTLSMVTAPAELDGEDVVPRFRCSLGAVFG